MANTLVHEIHLCSFGELLFKCMILEQRDARVKVRPLEGSGDAWIAVDRVRVEEAKEDWTVLVGNVGQVYRGESRAEATQVYNDYVHESKSGLGRVGGEAVSLMESGDLKACWCPETGLVGV